MSAGWLFVTSNENKWREAQLIFGRDLDRITLELPEIQAPTTMEVAVEKAKVAFALLKRPVIIEDAGVELQALGGFPGPFIKYWDKLGGLESICRAADGLKDRRAQTVCALVAWDAQRRSPSKAARRARSRRHRGGPMGSAGTRSSSPTARAAPGQR